MKEEKYNKLKKIFEKNSGYARTKDILNAGINSYYLYRLLENNTISKIKRGLYHWDDNDYDVNHELVQVSKIVPKGVICLLSALSYYEITTINSWEYYIAIHRDDRKPIVPDYPPINFFYFSEKQYKTGIQEIEINNNKVKIYDIEKTICDCLRFRNKIGMDVVKEAMIDYIKKQDSNINKLLKYAEITGIYNLAKKYLEVLV